MAFERGESIWTESSYKFQPRGLVQLGARAGLAMVEQWVDGSAGFALTLFRRVVSAFRLRAKRSGGLAEARGASSRAEAVRRTVIRRSEGRHLPRSARPARKSHTIRLEI